MSIAFVPVLPVLLGSVVMLSMGLPTFIWVSNLLCLLLGGLAYTVIAVWLKQIRFSTMAFLALAVVACTNIFPGLDGVTRWIDIGMVRLHASGLASPPFIVSLAVLIAAGRMTLVAGLACLYQVVHVVQPDAAQATALAAALTVMLLCKRPLRPTQIIASGMIWGLTAAAWLRRDPLDPVAHVEQIIGLAGTISTALVPTSWVFLMTLPIICIYLGCKNRVMGLEHLYFLGLGTYSMVIQLSPLIGNYPVPLMGYGGAPILGIYLGLGLVFHVQRPKKFDDNTINLPQNIKEIKAGE